MDRPDKKNNKKTKTVKGSPRVPIKTYHWEDLHRARKLGGYPWTYLYKQPYDGIVDPEEFTMEGLSKSKSSSTIGKESQGVEIHEMTNEEMTKLNTNLLSPEPIVTQEDSANEDVESENELAQKPEIVAMEESAESSDNISQYLDKEYKIPSNSNISDIPGSSKTDKRIEDTPTPTNEKTERAKSEEPKKKRKLSIESSYSRISLSKLSVMKKLKEAKDKIKVPKLPKITFSTASTRQFRPKNQKKKASIDVVVKKEPKKDPTAALITAKPVYIHIPLKPPEGQSDEFSYLEFGEKKPEEKKEETKPKLSKFKLIGAKVMQEAAKTTEAAQESQETSQQTTAQDINGTLNEDQQLTEATEPEKMDIKISKTEISDEKGPSVIELIPKEPTNSMNQSDDMKIEASLNTVSNEDKKLKPEGQSGSESDEIDTKIFYIPGPSTSSDLEEEDEKENKQTKRAKSAEPERKRKLSVDSAYSRISLSKLSVLKKLQDVKNKIKFPKLSLPSLNLTKTESKKRKPKSKKDDVLVPLSVKKETQKDVVQKNVKPVYIHIPLKPPPGDSDEFSHLESQSKTPGTTKVNEETPESPDSTGSIQENAVQFIFLTAPSDDETLDEKVQVPDTPSSINTSFFDANKLEAELKTIAKVAVDRVSPESKKKQLEIVEEGSENNSEKLDLEEATTENTPEREIVPMEQSGLKIEEEQGEKQINENDDKEEKSETDVITLEESEELKDTTEETTKEIIVIDEEDGLKSSETVQSRDKKEDVKTTVEQKELKSVLKSESSPILKKKVSFKRKPKPDANKDYEEIKKPESSADGSENQENEDKLKISVLGTSQSMSVDEEKMYLDQKIMKTTSLEEDYNRWSKLR